MVQGELFFLTLATNQLASFEPALGPLAVLPSDIVMHELFYPKVDYFFLFYSSV